MTALDRMASLSFIAGWMVPGVRIVSVAACSPNEALCRAQPPMAIPPIAAGIAKKMAGTAAPVPA